MARRNSRALRFWGALRIRRYSGQSDRRCSRSVGGVRAEIRAGIYSGHGLSGGLRIGSGHLTGRGTAGRPA
jgi:hypothetical protein